MLRDVSILGTARIVPAGLALVQSIVLARVLGPEAFGAVALIAAYPSLVFGILNVRTVETTTRFLSDYDTRGLPGRALGLSKVSYIIDLAAAGAAAATVALTARWVAPTSADGMSLAPLMILFGVSFVPNALVPTSSGIFVVTGNFLLAGTLEVAGAALRTVLVIGFVLAGLGVPGVVAGIVAASAAYGLATVLVAHRVARRQWRGSWLLSRWSDLSGERREIVRFFAFSDLTALCTAAIKNADVLLLGYFRPTVEVGYYNLGKSLTGQLLVVTSAVRAVAFPQIMRLWTTGAWNRLWAHVRAHTWQLAVPGTAGILLLMLVMEPAILLVYGAEFVPAAPVARLLLGQVILLLLTLWIDMVFLAWGDVHVLLIARATGALVTIVGIVVLVDRLGIAAAALSLLLQQTLSAAITVFWMYAHRSARAAEAARRMRVSSAERAQAGTPGLSSP